MKASIVAVALIAALMSPLCRAERVQIPLALDERFIESLLRDRVFTDAGESLRLNDDGSGCQHLVLRQPEVSASGGQVRVQVAAQVRAGRAIVGGRCLLGLDWSGRLELVQTPVIGEDGRSIALRTASWRVLRADGSTDRVSTTVGLWLEQYLPVDLERTPLDLSEPIGELPEFLALVMTGEDAERLDALVESIAIDGVTVANGRVTVTV